MVRFLLDTNILSEPSRPNPNPNVLRRMNQYRFQVGVSSVVVSELLYGCWKLLKSRRRDSLWQYLQDSVLTLPIFDYDLRAARWHAEERVRLSQLGKTPSFIDGQIASIAAVNSLVLVTRNVRDFANFQGITVENWFED
ncbi:type II toxin-antitoxin system VapC family toxin [Roseofilum sp. Guam]|uniref:type II toxin-antitoxin system VapC family toxin n=1 Tax=Roseofilum sp. Guam TaxID=2821502 RepID=UPI001B0E0885|nr:type II toxin-antitoxin system VapC family toxin [Roseofilum sp. Guam]MBP0030709.1 type II toxin-antitoxin system VapC family toxin [Roseofilum sp. Guam]